MAAQVRTGRHGLDRNALPVSVDATTMEPLWWERCPKPMMLTLKNIADEVYKCLKLSAPTHRRSMSNEAIVRLEAALPTSSVTVAERLARARALRAVLPKGNFRAQDRDADKREGCP